MREEALADIVAEMRTRSREVKEAFGGRPDGVENMLDIWADRIEAARKRQEKTYLDQIRDAMNMWGHEKHIAEHAQKPTVGNAAAIRDALKEIDRVVWDKKRHTKEETEAHRLSTEALSVPARNCDVYTHDEALEVWEAEKENERNGCFDEWLYHVAAEEGAGT